MNQSTNSHNNGKLQPYLSPLAVWALSVGSAIGWGTLVVTSKFAADEPMLFKFLFQSGHYASLIANDGMDYDPAAIRRSLISMAEAIIGKDE